MASARHPVTDQRSSIHSSSEVRAVIRLLSAGAEVHRFPVFEHHCLPDIARIWRDNSANNSEVGDEVWGPRVQSLEQPVD